MRSFLRTLSKVASLGLLTLWACMLPRLGFADDDAGIKTVSGDCLKSGLVVNAWAELTRKEPRLQQIITQMYDQTDVKPANNQVPMDNCMVSWPEDLEGKPVLGVRNVIMSRTWSNDDGKNTYMGGIRMSYEFNWASELNPASIQPDAPDFLMRKILGFAYCKSEDACQFLGIPFRSTQEKDAVYKRVVPAKKMAQRPTDRF